MSPDPQDLAPPLPYDQAQTQEKEETTPPSGMEHPLCSERTPIGTRRTVDKEATPDGGDMGKKRNLTIFIMIQNIFTILKVENRRGGADCCTPPTR